ncbi:hypothetical protein Tco_1562007 [Tanacetum coccineum]
MKDVFESTESELNELEKQNELLKDQLLEASLAEDIKNLVITSCVEIRNKDLHDEIDRISKESKDVSNESKTADTVCNDAFGVTQELSKRIVELEKDLSKFEAKTYKDLFESVQRSKVETNPCDEVKVKDNFDEIKTKNIELEYQVASLIKENEHLKLTYKNLFDSIKKSRVQTKTSNVTQNEAENLKSQLFEFAETKFIDVQKDLSKPVTAQSLPKNEKYQLLKQIAYLESKLASQDIHSCQKEYHELRTLYNALKVKFDSLNRKKRETNVSKSLKPRESVSAKVRTGESSKPFSRRVSQFTTYSLQKDRKFFKNSQSFEALTPQKGFKKRALNAKHQSFETTYSCNTPVKQVWRPKQGHLKTFKYSKSEMFSLQNKNDLDLKNKNNGRLSNASKTNFQNDTSNGNNKWKFSSSTRFKNSHETPSFKNKWKIKRNFKFPLIPLELFSNETSVSSPCWNSTSLHRIDTTLKWFSKLGKPVSTVLKWVLKVVV